MNSKPMRDRHLGLKHICKILRTGIPYFKAEDGIRDLYVTGVQTLCSSDLKGAVLALGLPRSRRNFPRAARHHRRQAQDRKSVV